MDAKRPNYGCFRLGCGMALAIVGLVLVLNLLPRHAQLALSGRQPTEAELLDWLGGDRVAATLRNFDHAEAVLLDSPALDTAWRARDFKVVSEPKVVDEAVSGEIAKTLLAPDQHRRIPPKACAPIYGVKLTYFGDVDRVDIYFCFECALLEIHLNDEPVGEMAFDFPYQTMVEAVRKVFPDNAQLTKLVNERWR